MKIAIICSPETYVPPKKTGGVEQGVYYLAKELAGRGHKITIFAKGGKIIENAEINNYLKVPALHKMEHLNLRDRVLSFYNLMTLAELFSGKTQNKYDIIYYTNYIFYEILPFLKFTKTPVIVRINYPHNEIYPYMRQGLRRMKKVRYLPASDFIKKMMPKLNYTKKMFSPIDLADFKFREKTGDYLLSIGRICADKGAHLAVKVAIMSKKKLIIAGGVSPSDYQYFNQQLRPMIDNKNIIYVGEVNFKAKVKLFGRALATLFPIVGNEAYGNVPAESMACGTPVIAFDRASVKEIIKHKQSGFIVKDRDLTAMVSSVKKIYNIDRKKVRDWAEKKFSARMAADTFESICVRLINRKL